MDWLLIGILHALGMLAAVHAILTSRTPEGAIAWGVSLFTFPYVALPWYLVFGRDRFNGYVHALRKGGLAAQNKDVGKMVNAVHQHAAEFEPDRATTMRALGKLAKIPFSKTCSVELLIDGEQTYRRMYEEIAKAEQYILVLFFIVNKDDAGQELKRRLIEKVQQGVRVYFVYDELGSNKIHGSYVSELREGGVTAYSFRTTRGWTNRFQLNFRNHRKIVVIDGKVGLTGGLNIGDECLGKSKHYGAWRDTFTLLRGPAVMALQLAFIEDYHWATAGELPEVDWTPYPCSQGNLSATYVSTGPADLTNAAIQFYMECILSAKERLWLASPYFVPDPSIMDALKLADLRGVDVRIMIPRARYEPHMRLAALAFLPDLRDTGIKVYEYQGYNHSKTMLVDDWLAWVGSSNLDNRSLRLNFEGNLIVAGETFAADVENMYLRDFSKCRVLQLKELNRHSWLTQIGTKVARLFVPIM
jgi:cardiolipin synthase A/B